MRKIEVFKKILNKRIKVSTTSQRYTGFTLAEVLITLGIIGVVAALTIPNLIKGTSNLENKTAFKKMYTNLAQVVQRAAYNNGGSIDGQFGSDDNSLKNFFVPYFKAVKACDTNDSSCWTCSGKRTDDYFLNGASVTTTSGLNWWYKNRPTIVLADGAMINIANNSSSCTGSDIGLIAPYLGTLCGGFIVDVNGCKSPNTWGRDIFLIEVQKNNIFSEGPSFNNAAATLGCNKNASWMPGWLCAEYVLKNEDY